MLRLDVSELKKRRMARGWTQGDLARRVGVTTSRVSEWERGVGGIRPSKVPKLAKILRIDPMLLCRLIDGEDERAKSEATR